MSGRFNDREKRWNDIVPYRAIDAYTSSPVFVTYIKRRSLIGDILIESTRICVTVTVAFFAVKTSATRRTGSPLNLIVHWATLFTSFSTRVTLTFAFLMLNQIYTYKNKLWKPFNDDFFLYFISYSTFFFSFQNQ